MNHDNLMRTTVCIPRRRIHARRFSNGHQILRSDRWRILCDRNCGRSAVFCEYMGVSSFNYCKRHWNEPGPSGSSPRERAHLVPPTTGQDVLRAVSLRTGVSKAAIVGPSRVKHIVAARHEVARGLRAIGWSYPAIARMLGRVDHSSAIHMVHPERRREKHK
jgi:Bacterial dnaA protein helix-turn-helix